MDRSRVLRSLRRGRPETPCPATQPFAGRKGVSMEWMRAHWGRRRGGVAVGREFDDEFAEFVTRWSPALLRVAFLLTSDRGEAEDLLQTALLKTSRHWSKLTDHEAALPVRAPGAGHHAHQLAAPAAGARGAARPVPRHSTGEPTSIDVGHARSRRWSSCPRGCARWWCSAATRASPRPRPPRPSGARSAR